MILIVFLIVTQMILKQTVAWETFSSKKKELVPWWMDNSTKVTEHSNWWESYTEPTKAWWNNFTTVSTDATTVSKARAKFLVPSGNFTLAPADAIDLFKDPQKLNKMITEQTQKLFGEDKPEFHELIAMWLFMLVNRTKVDRNSTFVTREFTYEMRTTTAPTTTQRAPDITTTEEIWAGPVGGTENMVTSALDMDAGPKGSGTGQADLVTGQAGLDTGQEDSGTGQMVDTGQTELVTMSNDLGMSLGPGQVDVGTEQVDVGTGQVDVDTGRVDVGTGQVDVGTGQVDVGTGQNNSEAGPPYTENMGVTTDTDADDTTVVIEWTTQPRPMLTPRSPIQNIKQRPGLRYVDGQGRPLFQPPGGPGSPASQYHHRLREAVPLAPQGYQPGVKGYPPVPQGSIGRAPELPFVVTSQPTEQTVTATTTSTTAAPTEASTRHAAGRQFSEYNELMVRPGYEELAGYISSGRPNMVNEANMANMLIDGLVSPTTATEHPLVATMKRDMAGSNNGYFTIFLKKMSEIIVTMEKEQAGYLFVATDLVFNDLERQQMLRFLGMPLQPSLLRVSSMLASVPPEIAQSNAKLAYIALSDRSLVPRELNGILIIMDSMYYLKEGDALFASLIAMEGYPDNNVTSRQVMKGVIDAILAPFIRLKGTDRLNSILYKLNNAIADNYPYRRDYARAQRARPLRFGATDSENHLTATATENPKRAKLKEVIHETARNRYRHKNIVTLKKKGISRHKGKVDAIDLTKIKHPESQGLEETDTDFRLDNPKHEIHSKKNVKQIVKDHLKNKHYDLYEIYRQKQIKDKRKNDAKKAAVAAFKNRILQKLKSEQFDADITRNKDNSKREVSEKKPKKPQTRFNIINSVVDGQSGEKKMSTKFKTELSKYLTKYKLKTKRDKKQFKNRARIPDDSLSDEKDLKFNLQDTLRHGDRKFAERRNYRIKNKNDLHELSSYSDEEGVLKNNIYKVFGYTQRY